MPAHAIAWLIYLYQWIKFPVHDLFLGEQYYILWEAGPTYSQEMRFSPGILSFKSLWISHKGQLRYLVSGFFLKKKAEFIVDSFFVVFTSKFGARKHFKWLFSLSNISQEILRTVSRRLMKLTTCGYFTIQSTSNSVSPLFMRRLNHMNCKVQNSLWTNLYSIENSVSIMWFFDRTWLSYWPRSGM